MERIKENYKEISTGLDDFALIFDNLQEDVGVYEIVYDDAGVPEDLIFRYVNPVALRRAKGVKKDFIGKKFSEIHQAKTTKFHVEFAQKVLETGKSEKYETRIPQLNRYYSVNAFSPKRIFTLPYLRISQHVKKLKKLFYGTRNVMNFWQI